MSSTSSVLLDVLVDADDDVLAGAVALLVAPGRLVDLVRDELDRVDRAAELVDLLDQLPARALDLVGQRLDEVGAGERVDGVGRAGLVGDDLLRAQRDLRGALASAARAPRRSRWCAATACRRRPRRSPAARRARRCSPAAGRSASRRRSACGSAASCDFGSLRAEALAHDVRPHPPGGAELRDLLEDVVVAVEEERQARARTRRPRGRRRSPPARRRSRWTA